MADLSKSLRRFGVADALLEGAKNQYEPLSRAYWAKHLNEGLDTPGGRGQVAKGGAGIALGTNALVQSAGGWKSLIKHTPSPLKVPEIGSKLMNPSAAEINAMARDASAAGKQSFVSSGAQKMGAASRVALPVHMAASGIGTAVQGLSTPTEEYEGRTGLRGLPARAAGVMQDLGNNLTFGVAGQVGEKISSMIGGGDESPPQPDATDPNQALRDATPTLAGQESDFEDVVRSGEGSLANEIGPAFAPGQTYDAMNISPRIAHDPLERIAQSRQEGGRADMAAPRPSIPIGYGPPTGGMRASVTNAPGGGGEGLRTGTLAGINPLETNPMAQEEEQRKKGAMILSARG